MSVKVEHAVFPDGEEASSFHTPELKAVVKLEKEVLGEDEFGETGNSAHAFDIETDKTRGIKTERVDSNLGDSQIQIDCISSHAVSTSAVERNTLIKKEKDVDADDEAFQAIFKSNFRLSLEGGKHFKREEKSNQSMASYDRANESIVEIAKRENCNVSPTSGLEEKLYEPQRSRAYYYRYGFKLAHVSVLLEDLNLHPIAHTFEKQYSRTAESRKGFVKSHSKILTNQERFSYGHSPVEVKQTQCVKNQLTTDTGDKPYSCIHCPAKFALRSSLNAHLRIHPDEKQFLCTYCFAKFSRKKGLQSHSRIHSDKKLMTCRYCQQKFHQESSLKSHLWIHSKEKPYSCRNCPATFTNRRSLMSHMWFHRAEQTLFSCLHCPAKFNDNSSLNDHLSVHAHWKPLTCTHCPAKFNQEHFYKRHLSTHSEEKR